MNDTAILLSLLNTSDDKRQQAAGNLIKNYNLPLTQPQILSAFEEIRKFAVNHETRYYKNRLSIMTELLRLNINFYIAIIIALNNNVIHAFNLSIIHITSDDSTIYNWYECTSHSAYVYTFYRMLLDCYEFDFENLSIACEHKYFLERYRQERYSGKLIKPVNTLKMIFKIHTHCY
jgi:hypothetical protein